MFGFGKKKNILNTKSVDYDPLSNPGISKANTQKQEAKSGSML
mgnify:CR=1 FL=1